MGDVQYVYSQKRSPNYVHSYVLHQMVAVPTYKIDRNFGSEYSGVSRAARASAAAYKYKANGHVLLFNYFSNSASVYIPIVYMSYLYDRIYKTHMRYSVHPEGSDVFYIYIFLFDYISSFLKLIWYYIKETVFFQNTATNVVKFRTQETHVHSF